MKKGNNFLINSDSPLISVNADIITSPQAHTHTHTQDLHKHEINLA